MTYGEITANDLMRLHEMAKSFADLYGRSGMIDVGPNEVFMKAVNFFNLFGDREYEYLHNENGGVQTVIDGVRYYTILRYDTLGNLTREVAE